MAESDISLGGEKPYIETPFAANSMNKRGGPRGVDPETVRKLLRDANKSEKEAG